MTASIQLKKNTGRETQGVVAKLMLLAVNCQCKVTLTLTLLLL
jgi:hypothetical protein